MKHKINTILTSKYQNIIVSLFAIICGLSIGAIILLLLKKNPIQAYQTLLQGSGLLPKPVYANNVGMLSDFMSFLDLLAPMIFASLAVGVALKSGIFN
ncbi:MAG: ABC transporter permease, partial [Bacilli bacterium]